MNLKDPRTQLSYLLILIFLSAVFYYKDILLIKNLLIAVSSTVFFDFLFWKLRKIEFFPPAAAITTGIIISLLMSPKLPAYEIIMASFLAILSKNFIRGFNRHIFNPAGFGVFFTSLAFWHSVSWWGVSFQSLNPIYLLTLFSPLVVSVVRLKRYRIILPFLIFFSLLNYLIYLKPVQNIIIDPTILFFSLVMLPEPQTTPNKPTWQVIFGFFIALFAIISSKFFASIDPLIFALLAGNLIFYRLK